MKVSPEFSAALSKLRDAAVPTCRDARLLDACDRFCDIWADFQRLHREKPVGFQTIIDQEMEEFEALIHEIAHTDAWTGMGRGAKHRCIMCLIEDDDPLGQLIGSMVADYGRPGVHNRIQLF